MTIPPDTPTNPSPLPAVMMMAGSKTMASEVMVAWEAGYRSRPTDGLLLDATVFLMKHDRIRGFVPGEPSVVAGPSPHVSVPVTLANLAAGEARGVELASDWYPLPRLRLRAAYSYLQLRQTRGGGASEDGPPAGEFADRTNPWKISPSHQARLWASFGLGRAWDLDLAGRHVSALRGQRIPAYTVFDARLAWRPSPPLEISVSGRNLGPASHEEFGGEFNPTGSAVKPAVYAAVALIW
jgi:iron complex outermembrane receptor protein